VVCVGQAARDDAAPAPSPAPARRTTFVRIHRRFLLEPLLLDVAEVMKTADSGEFIGSCSCGSYLYLDGNAPQRGYADRGPLWVQLVCRACGHEIAAPDGRLARRLFLPTP
jgi:hypothetical protein